MTKTFRIAVVCAVLFCLTLPAPASAQYEEARRLALAAMSPEERDVFEQTSEKTKNKNQKSGLGRLGLKKLQKRNFTRENFLGKRVETR